MKKLQWVGLLGTAAICLFSSCVRGQVPPPAPAPMASATQPADPNAGSSISPNASEVVKMASAGTSDDVLLAYVQNSQSTFDLSADNVLYLKDVGLSSQVITAMLTRDQTLHNQGASYAYNQRAYAPTIAPPAEPAPVAAAPAPAPEAAPAPVAPAPAPAPAPTYVSSPPADVSYFYSDLSPYGTWVDLPGYGWCWQPTVVVVNHSWRPYCDSGHWVWTDAGWCWVSDYSWGWAPFHYGRWYLHAGCGWVWVPDRVWGPAWVVWRNGGDNCGWAPLPPRAEFVVGVGWRFNGVHVGVDFDFGLHADCFTFIAMGDFCEHDLHRRCLPPAQVTRIYNHTTIINNYTVVNNTTIINHGIPVERVSAATQQQIRPAVIRELPAAGTTRVAARTTGNERGNLVVYRPQLHAPARPVNMVAQKVDERHPVIQHAVVKPPAATMASQQRFTPRDNTVIATQQHGAVATPSHPGVEAATAHQAPKAEPAARPTTTVQHQAPAPAAPSPQHTAQDTRQASSHSEESSPSTGVAQGNGAHNVEQAPRQENAQPAYPGRNTAVPNRGQEQNGHRSTPATQRSKPDSGGEQGNSKNKGNN